MPAGSSRNPAVSIGLPVYNGARFLRRSLDALLSQTLTDFELLISDNGSSDSTPEIASEYAARDARVRIVRSPVNRGFEANFERVLRETSGRYYMWAACDDWWAPTFVERAVQALEGSPTAIVAMSGVVREDEDGRPVDTVRFVGSRDPSKLSAGRLAMALAAGLPYHLFVYGLFRADVLRGLFTGLPPVIASDRLFMCRVALTGGFASIPDPLHTRLVHRVGIGERYPDEDTGRQWQERSARWRLARMAGPYLWRSPGVPFRRKLWIPAVTLRFVTASLGHSLVTAGLIRLRGHADHRAC